MSKQESKSTHPATIAAHEQLASKGVKDGDEISNSLYLTQQAIDYCQTQLQGGNGLLHSRFINELPNLAAPRHGGMLGSFLDLADGRPLEVDINKSFDDSLFSSPTLWPPAYYLLLGACHDGDAKQRDNMLYALATCEANFGKKIPGGNIGGLEMVLKELPAPGAMAVAVWLITQTNTPLSTPNLAGETPLHTSIRSGFSDVSIALIGKKAGINTANRTGQRPLDYALAHDRTGTITSALLDAKVNVNYKNAAGDTPLIIATRAAASPAGDVSVVRTILALNADIHATDAAGNTALHIAAASGNPALIGLLLDKGANATLTNRDGATPQSIYEQSPISGYDEEITSLATPKAEAGAGKNQEQGYALQHSFSFRPGGPTGIN